jgi:hypothetical protein
MHCKVNRTAVLCNLAADRTGMVLLLTTACVALSAVASQATAPGSYQPQFAGGFGRGGAQ